MLCLAAFLFELVLERADGYQGIATYDVTHGELQASSETDLWDIWRDVLSGGRLPVTLRVLEETGKVRNGRNCVCLFGAASRGGSGLYPAVPWKY